MAQAGIIVEVGRLARSRQLLDGLSDKQLARATKRAVSTLTRRMVPEASRLLSEDVLNLRPRQISSYLDASVSGDTITLRGSKSRLPLSAFGARWGGRTTAGAEAVLWRDGGARTFVHTFKIRGSKQIWQRVPYSGQAKSASSKIKRGLGGSAGGLVNRLPIVVRKGPSFSRAVTSKRHGDIYPPLLSFARTFVVSEMQRQLGLSR